MAIPVFNECCCCVDLKAGAYILGILNCIQAAFGVIEIIVFFIELNGLFLGFALIEGAYILSAIAFLRLVSDPNSKERKDQFADWYLYSLVFGLACFFVIMLCYGFVAIAFVDTIIAGCFGVYFWLCVRSYAQAHDRMMQAAQGGQQVLI